MVQKMACAGWCLMALALVVSGCTPSSGSRTKATQNAKVQYTLGVAELKNNNPTMALAKFLEAEKFDKNDSDIQEGLAQAYQRKGAFAEAEKHYLRAIELRPDEPRYFNNLGALYLDMQRPDDALLHLNKAATNLLFPQPEIPLTGIGMAYFMKQEHQQSIASYREALSKNPRYIEAYLRLGEVLTTLGQVDRGLIEYKKALLLAPEYGRLHFYMGMAYMKNGQMDPARQAFLKVRELIPESEMGIRAGDYLDMLQ
ncbi:TPR domain lipoprotein [Syntrophotalea carbinolica DSM 2380]|uniref:TPR domain lipoprotein n=1 Tax=Syntrophotalea carbinolica (strain DSM 2380 / NBRC 103641 / GraBd1) TaxID=338963 RepID=Q3A2Z6_SYNC1|nr:tetratricopeptide repeat protein [Syntrophotalea carbinolica]ABA89261.2 TPR domain lipoprotein [Syntrophotalea carbinolica DSM 2380]